MGKRGRRGKPGPVGPPGPPGKGEIGLPGWPVSNSSFFICTDNVYKIIRNLGANLFISVNIQGDAVSIIVLSIFYFRDRTYCQLFVTFLKFIRINTVSKN